MNNENIYGNIDGWFVKNDPVYIPKRSMKIKNKIRNKKRRKTK